MSKNKVGAPPKVTETVLQQLKEAFAWGCTDAEACCYAEISTSTLYNYCTDNPDFLELKNKLKDMPSMKAKRIITASLDSDDLATANRVIDRKEGTKVKQELTGANGGPVALTTFNFIPVGTND